MNRYIKVEAVKSKCGEIIPLFELKAYSNDDYNDENQIDLLSEERETFTDSDTTLEVFYDLLTKKVVSPYSRVVTILDSKRGFNIGDKVTVECGYETVYVDFIKDILPGRLEFTDFVSKEHFDLRYKNENTCIVSDEGDKNSPLIKINYVDRRYILEKGEVIDYSYKLKKIVVK